MITSIIIPGEAEKVFDNTNTFSQQNSNRRKPLIFCPIFAIDSIF